MVEVDPFEYAAGPAERDLTDKEDMNFRYTL